MRPFNFLATKKIGIFGLGITGTAAFNAICNIAKQIITWDDKSINREKFSKEFGSSSLVDLNDTRWRNLDQVLLSPGVPLTHEIRKIVDSAGIEIISDIDILFEECKTAKFIGITGTNGKSTTTALTYHILKNAKYDFAMGGNIGVPALGLPLHKKGYVLELSSFQLDLSQSFRSTIAVLLNITPDHLDRYKTLSSYAAAKEKILNSLASGGYAVVGVDNEITAKMFQKFSVNNSRIIPISSTKIMDCGISVIGDEIYDNMFKSVVTKLPDNKSLQGNHNKENIAASIAICRLLDVDYAKIIEAVESFKGLPHRSEYLGIYKNIHFYNDSKATNADAASKSISFLDNIYWLAGGIAKEGDISELKPLFGKIRKAYLFGQDKDLFAKTLKGSIEFEICEDLKQAFSKALSDAANDESKVKNILLAPAAASMDQFKNFEHRGEVFKQLFTGLTQRG